MGQTVLRIWEFVHGGLNLFRDRGLYSGVGSHMHKNGVCYTTMAEQMAPVEATSTHKFRALPKTKHTTHTTHAKHNRPDCVRTSRENNTAYCLRGERREGRLVKAGLRGEGAGDKTGHSQEGSVMCRRKTHNQWGRLSRMSLIAGLDSPLERGTGTFDSTECST